jgi:hypothetical protein
VSTATNNDDDKNAIVSVMDSGAGMDSEILPQLFTKFASKSFQDTGLGLFISKSIIEVYGGRIWAKNNPDGKGAILHSHYQQVPNNPNTKPLKTIAAARAEAAMVCYCRVRITNAITNVIAAAIEPSGIHTLTA